MLLTSSILYVSICNMIFSAGLDMKMFTPLTDPDISEDPLIYKKISK